MHKQTQDQIGRCLSVPDRPRRVISLVPSQTELICDLDRSDCLVGITRYCIHPKEALNAIPIVGGTKKINRKTIDALNPDLIIGNKEENVREEIECLAADYPVWISDVRDINTAYDMMHGIGCLLNAEAESNEIVKVIRQSFATLPEIQKKQRAAYLIWRKPYMVAGGDTFIQPMLELCGFENVFSHHPHRYPAVTVDELVAAAPEILLLSSEPFPFQDKHIEECQERLPDTRIELVDGEIFSWFGSRIRLAADYFRSLRQILVLE